MSEKEKVDDSDSNPDSEEALAKPLTKQRYPRAVFFIIGNEFCERFSYYGMKNVLALYFTNVLLYSDDKATEYYHIFSMLCYFTPIIGAYIADTLMGKYKTIFYISFIYAAGNIVLSLASYFENQWVTLIGLLLIALGTGGIKPCVSAFGADQFNKGQEHHLKRFFSFFYISINAGSLISNIITPILRKDVSCSERNDCFPLAFGVPSVLMLAAIAFFIIGRYITHYKMVPPKKENIVVTVICCTFYSLWKKITNIFSRESRAHWLDYGTDKYDEKTVRDIKALMGVLFLYLPLPIFWALFDQQGSRWTLQATRMDGNFFGVYRFYPDQISFLNSFLIIVFVPLFEYGIYPLLDKVGLLKRSDPKGSLKKMTSGGILAALSFIICAFLQLSIETGLPVEPKGNHAHVAIANGLPCNIEIDNIYGVVNEISIPSGSAWHRDVDLDAYDPNFKVKCGDATYDAMVAPPNGEDMPIYYFYGEDGTRVLIDTNTTRKDPKNLNIDYLLSKPREGGANVRIFFSIVGYNNLTDPPLFFQFNDEDAIWSNKTDQIKWTSESTGYSFYNELEVFKVDSYDMYIQFDGGVRQPISAGIVKGEDQGGSYFMFVNGSYLESNHSLLGESVVRTTIVNPNTVLMILQVFQFIVITAGEILFSVVGLEFSYSQSPKSMKSVLQAAWLLTVAFGNVIVVIVASAKFFDKQSTEFFFFAGLMFAFMALFALMGFFYKPREQKDNDDYDDDDSLGSDDSIAAIKRENKRKEEEQEEEEEERKTNL